MQRFALTAVRSDLLLCVTIAYTMIPDTFTSFQITRAPGRAYDPQSAPVPSKSIVMIAVTFTIPFPVLAGAVCPGGQCLASDDKYHMVFLLPRSVSNSSCVKRKVTRVYAGGCRTDGSLYAMGYYGLYCAMTDTLEGFFVETLRARIARSIWSQYPPARPTRFHLLRGKSARRSKFGCDACATRSPADSRVANGGSGSCVSGCHTVTNPTQGFVHSGCSATGQMVRNRADDHNLLPGLVLREELGNSRSAQHGA